MKCYSCGNEVRDDARFCFHCGANLTEAPAPAAEPVPQMPVQEVPVQQTPVQEAPVQYVPAQQTPVQEVPVQQVPVQQIPAQPAPAQPKYEYTPPAPQPQPQPQAPAFQPWTQPVQPWTQQPQAQPQMPYHQSMPNTQYVYTYAPQAAPGSPQIVYVKTKTRGRGFGISSMVLGIIGLYYALSGMAMVGEFAQLAVMGEEMLGEMMGEMMGEIPSGMFAESIAVSLGVFGIMPLLALIFGICARKRGYKNGVSMSGLILGIIGLVLIILEIFALLGSGI